MSQGGSIEQLISRLKKLQPNTYINTLKNESKKALDVAMYNSVQEMSKELKPNFDRIVNSEFYDAYSPKFYGDERRFSMRNVMPDGDPDITLLDAPEGSAVSVNIQTNKNAMTFRKGGTNLIYLTLGQGYHGGAAGTDRHGESVGIPHYRRPLNVWSRWGSPAVSGESPWELYKKWFEDFWSDKTFQPLLEKHFYPKFKEVLSVHMKNI